MGFEWITNNIWAVIFGIIVGYLTHIIIEFLPITPRLRFKTMYLRKKFCKWLKNEGIDTELNIKTQDLTDKKLEPEKIRDKIKKTLSEKGIKSFGKENNIKFDFKSGETDLSALLSFAYEETEEEEENKIVISQIETALSAKCKYKKFDGHILDLEQVEKLIDEVLREHIPDIKLKHSLTCKLKHLYELTGVLSKSDLDVLVAKNQNYEIEMFSNRVIAYGDITQNLTTILKDLIVIYN